MKRERIQPHTVIVGSFFPYVQSFNDLISRGAKAKQKNKFCRSLGSESGGKTEKHKRHFGICFECVREFL